MKSAWSALIVSSLSAAAQAAVVISDGEWADWELVGISAKVGAEPEGGNPGARLRITTISGPIAYGVAISHAPILQEPLMARRMDVTFEVLSGPGAFNQGQTIALALMQGESIYVDLIDITGFPLDWDELTFGANLRPCNFQRIDGDGPDRPVVDGSVATRLGFAAANSNSGSLTHYYDNIVIELGPLGESCPADIDLSGDVGSPDLNLLLADFGCASACCADVDGDGDTDSADLNILLAAFGNACP